MIYLRISIFTRMLAFPATCLWFTCKGVALRLIIYLFTRENIYQKYRTCPALRSINFWFHSLRRELNGAECTSLKQICRCRFCLLISRQGLRYNATRWCTSTSLRCSLSRDEKRKHMLIAFSMSFSCAAVLGKNFFTRGACSSSIVAEYRGGLW